LTDADVSTPLHVCAAFSHLEATKILVEVDAAINNTNKYLFSPVMLGVFNCILENVRYIK
jgi:ankyrin repeat protein